jgi:hypothetical protein
MRHSTFAIWNWCGRAIRLWLVMAMFLLCFSGCESWLLQEKGFGHDNDLSETARQARSENGGKDKDKDTEYVGLTEKGRQIERDLNAQ